MKVALDATYSGGTQLTGIGVYSREILHGLARFPDVDSVWCYRPNRFLRALREPAPPRVSRRPLVETWLPPCDLFHGLNQRLPEHAARVASVATFHDLFVLTGEYSTAEFRERFAGQARDAAARASAIIAVSRFTATQVEELLGVEPARIHVIHHGIRPPVTPVPIAAREPIVLTVGAIQRRKNTIALVEAFEQTPPGWKLVLAGASTGFDARAALDRIAASARRPDIEVTGWIDDAALDRMYARASIFAFPSLDEGFGMPVLDAMARGVPVLTSARSALPEVAGEAAILVDPFDVSAIAEGLDRLMRSGSLRDEYARRGLERCGSFSWARAVEETRAVYDRLLFDTGKRQRGAG